MPREVRRNPSLGRRLRVEHLEDRRLLAVLTVQNDLDDTLANLAGDGELSLREAIEIANNPGTTIDGFVSNDVEDTIEFAQPFFDQPQTIFLQDGELEITETLTIDGPGQELLTIDAQQQSRVFHYSESSGDLTIDRLAITKGKTTEDNESIRNEGYATTYNGGGIRFASFGQLTVRESIIRNNSTAGLAAAGGGIFTQDGDVLIVKTTIEDNHAEGTIAVGGGVSNIWGDLTVADSTINNNSSYSNGAGIFAGAGHVLITNSTISGNSISGFGDGGGIFLSLGNLKAISSTIVGNFAESRGGGIVALSKFAVPSIDLLHTIVAGNHALSEGREILEVAGTEVTINHSLIGSVEFPELILDNVGNFFGELANPLNPLLGPLADNGGPTQTHALLPGSPALDAGDPAIGFNPGEFDQRGAPFSRVATGILSGVPQQRIDIGAYEAQSPPSADFVDDDHLNGQDFLAWQLGFGLTENATRADGDSDGDGDVDLSDLAAWRVSYGQTEAPPPPVVALGGRDQGSGVSEGVSAALVDAVLGLVGDERDEHEVVIADHLFVGVASDANESNFLPAVAAQSETSASHSGPTDEGDSLVFQVGVDLLGFGL